MIVDSQIHVWTEETPERPWIPGGKQRAHLAEALTWQKALPLMDEAGIDRAIIVPPTWPGDFNDHALEAAAAHPDRFAVMGRFAFEDPEFESVAADLEAAERDARHPRRVQSREDAMDRRRHRRLAMAGGGGRRRSDHDLRARRARPDRTYCA